MSSTSPRQVRDERGETEALFLSVIEAFHHPDVCGSQPGIRKHK